MAKRARVVKKYRFTKEYFEHGGGSNDQFVEYEKNGLSPIYLGHLKSNGYVYTQIGLGAETQTWAVQAKYVTEVTTKPTVLISI